MLESGIVESRNIHRYVAGADVDWDTVVKSVTNAWGVWAELQDLIQWMRDYNANPDRDRELRFYGMDGTGNWFHIQHPFNELMEFGRKVDAGLANDVQRIFEESGSRPQPRPARRGRRRDLAPPHCGIDLGH